MKLAKLLTDYLVAHKELSLEGFGHFILEPATEAISDHKAQPSIGDISFQFNRRAANSEGLVPFISKQTGKMHSLAISDLESYLEIGKQLLNISKPFVIEGMGSLVKTDHNLYVFSPHESLVAAPEKTAANKQRSVAEKEIHFEDNYLKPVRTQSNHSRAVLLWSLVVLGLGLMAWLSWFLYQQNQEPLEIRNQPPVSQQVQDGSTQNQLVQATDRSQMQPAPDSLQNPLARPDSNNVAVPTVHKQSAATFSVVLEYAQRNRAFKRFADLKEWGHKVQMHTRDSLTFKLSIPIDAPLTDSTRHRDSLSRFFGRKVWIETN